ncbi:hypothetical protein BaRGS_00005431 [Batillaria attramentaria]|uniref:SOCS box domain-containing protein n=1 Tax=Batillaria attramentaria TaxID=370345 RepID=A0ABD0LVG9_9CAEN
MQMPRQTVAFVNGSLFSVSTQADAGTVVVREFFKDASKPGGMSLRRELTANGSIISDRVLAQPIVICCQGNLVVAQFVIQHAQQVHFFVIDLAERKYFIFHDTNRHFIRDCAIMEGVMCSLSPDHHLMILRLPRSVMARPHKSSLTLTVKKNDPSQPISIINQITGTERFRLQDRRFYMLAFDPRCPRRLVSLSLNEYCTKCLVMARDQDSQTTIVQKVLPLGQLCVSRPISGNIENSEQSCEQSDGDSDASSESEDDSFDPPLAFHLISCSMEYCRMGDIIALCCCVVDSAENYYLRLFLLDSDSFSCIRQISQPIKKCEKLSEEPFQISFSSCDSQVVVQAPLKCDACASHVTLCRAGVPRELSLRGQCRVAVLRSLPPGGDIKSLPLPSALIEFLLFTNHRYRNV